MTLAVPPSEQGAAVAAGAIRGAADRQTAAQGARQETKRTEALARCKY
jgi:hypothetical protein